MTSLLISAPSGSRLLRSGFLLPALLVAIVAILVVAPLLRILVTTLTPEGVAAWKAVLASPLSANLWWRPLLNTMILGFSVGGGCLLIGCTSFVGLAILFSTGPVRRGYTHARRYIDAFVGVFFAAAGLKLLTAKI